MKDIKTCIKSEEINEILNIRYDLGKRNKDICVNSSGMNAKLTFFIISD